jgi:hypothetical protein
VNETEGGGCRKMGSPVDSHGLGWREEVMKMARNSSPAGIEARKRKEERRFCGIPDSKISQSHTEDASKACESSLAKNESTWPSVNRGAALGIKT